MILKSNNTNGHRITLFLILCLFGIIAAQSSLLNDKKEKRKTSGERVYLEHADELSFDEHGSHPDAQMLRGNVRFRHNGAIMTCDSAYFYQADNSFDAYSNVVITQGDSVELTSDFANYNGNTEMAEARQNVVLIHNESTLYTDFLNYDKLYNLAFFYDGGRLIDKDNTLVSDWGEYNLENHEAVFNYNVSLKNPQFDLYTDTMHYNTESKIAHIVGPSIIYSGSKIIRTKAGRYDTQKKYVELSKRYLQKKNIEPTDIQSDSTIHTDSIIRTDSLKKDTVVLEDTICPAKISVDMYSDSRNVIFTDTVNKNILICDYLYYEENEGLAVASDNPVTMEYSQGDTLYMHSDTIKMYTYNIDTDSVYRKIHCYKKVKAFRNDIQAIADSMMYNTADSCLTMYKSPILWNENKQVTGKKIIAFLEDSTLKKVDIIDNAVAGEMTKDKTRYNQVSSRDIYAYFEKGELVRTDAVDNVISVFYPESDKDSTAMMMNYLETDTMRIYLKDRQLVKIWAPQPEGMSYPLTQIPPGKDIVPGFEWYAYLRPTDRYDIFVWRDRRTPKKK